MTDFKTYLTQSGYSKKTIETRMVMRNAYLRWLQTEKLDSSEVTYNDILSFMKHCQQQGRSQRTIQQYIGVIKLHHKHLITEGQMAINPATDIDVKGVKRKSLYQIFQPHELHQLYSSYDSDTQDNQLAASRNKVMLGLLCYQGIQSSELPKLETQHINLREGTVEIPGGRKSNSRTMKLEAPQVMDIYHYLYEARPKLIALPPTGKAKAQHETKTLLIGNGGHHDNFHNFTKGLMAELRKQNPGLINAKQIRASVIVKWLRQYNLRKAQYLAGHRFISTTEGYKQNDVEGLRETVQIFHPLG